MNDRIEVNVNWPTFLSRHDMVWNRMPWKWTEAPFLGNGMMGTMIRQIGPQAVRWDVGRGDVQNHRRGTDIYGISRLPIGHFELHTSGKVEGGNIRLDLWNAEARGTIKTTAGNIQWRSFVHADHMLIVTELEPSAGEKDFRLEWQPEKAICPRQLMKPHEDYQHNPSFSQSIEDGIHLTVQPLLEGGETVTAWKKDVEKGKTILMASVAHSYPERTARQEAIGVIQSVGINSIEELVKSHRKWWHEFYPASFLTLPDPWWESFYWIQMYKLASGTRADRMLLDLNGPWLQPTPWPGTWWNLNIQLTYWPTYGSNRLCLGESLNRAMYENVDNLIDNVPDEYRHDSAGIGRVSGHSLISSQVRVPGSHHAEFGNLLWACHTLWLHYRHNMDDERLRNDLFPLLKRSVNFYLHFLSREQDGRLHLPTTYSPEYNDAEGPDCNYDLALLRWGCSTLVEISSRLEIDDPLVPKWQDVMSNLTDYPIDEKCYMIARGVPFAHGHRHYSHLLMLYPLYLVNRDQDGAEELARRSVEHWHTITPRGTGYTKTGASSIMAAFGLGDQALEKLNGMQPYITPNTMYEEAGPVIETPLSGAQSLHDMLIQSWGNTIRIFPAVAGEWRDLAFYQFRTEGAFLVSASREEGITRFVHIKSLAGEPCMVEPGLDGDVQVFGRRTFNLKEIQSGRFQLDLKKGEEALLWSGKEKPDLVIQALPSTSGPHNPFGLK